MLWRELGDQSRRTCAFRLIRSRNAHKFVLATIRRKCLHLTTHIEDMCPAEHADRVVVEHTARLIRVESVSSEHDNQKADTQYDFLCYRHFSDPPKNKQTVPLFQQMKLPLEVFIIGNR